MKKIKLFEIPIYSMRKEVYENKCYDYIEKNASQTSPDNYESFYNYLKNANLIKKPWLYNQIIGYIVISYNQGSIWFDEFATTDKRIRAISNTKHYITDLMLNGHHFYVSEKMSNEEIKQEIIRWLKGIEKEILYKVWYLDKELFINQLEYIDIKKMISKGSD